MINLIEHVRRHYVAYAIVSLALLVMSVYGAGLMNPFRGDDNGQIVDNVPVHSIKNIKAFFEGSTFYSNDPQEPLTGQYYRPLMTTTFSALYTLFGEKALYFHLTQMLIFFIGVIFLYLVLHATTRPWLAYTLSALYVVHPINSQLLYGIANMQDVLSMAFGMAAMWSVLRFQSTRALTCTILLLILSLYSKESGVFYSIVVALYLLWFDRKRLFKFASFLALPALLYGVMRYHAVGSHHTAVVAPIGDISVLERMLTIPSVLLLYIEKLVWPQKLSSTYYWVEPEFSLRHTLVPLLLVVALISLGLYVGVRIYRMASKARFYQYSFFGLWFALGMAACSQIIPFDMTASETWFAFPFIGLLGMVGIAFEARVVPATKPRASYAIVVALLVIIPALALRSHVRAYDWRSQERLAASDIASSKNNYAPIYLTDPSRSTKL